MEYAEEHAKIPSNYNIPEVNKTKTKPRYTTIETKIVRIKPIQKNDLPSPFTYKPDEAKDKL